MDILSAREMFYNDGLLVLDGLLQKAVIEEVNRSILKTFNDNLNHIGENAEGDIQSSVKALFKIDYDRYVSCVTSLYRKYSIQKVVLSDAIINAIKNIFLWDEIYLPGGTAVHVVSDSIRTKGRYMGNQPHQDFPSVQGSLDGMIIWIPLMRIDGNGYPLEIIKGSHNSGLYPTYGNGINPDGEILAEHIVDEDFHPVFCEPGDVVLMSNFTIHRTGQYGNSDIRMACSTRVDNGAEKTFIDRGYPSAYKRVVERKPMHDIIDIEYRLKKAPRGF
jgi:ectoine hydroxylase-related dioxygenase (phytanoyl-CoA dioxygenase family)